MQNKFFGLRPKKSGDKSSSEKVKAGVLQHSGLRTPQCKTL